MATQQRARQSPMVTWRPQFDRLCDQLGEPAEHQHRLDRFHVAVFADGRVVQAYEGPGGWVVQSDPSESSPGEWAHVSREFESLNNDEDDCDYSDADDEA